MHQDAFPMSPFGFLIVIPKWPLVMASPALRLILLQSQQSYKPVAHAEDQEVILDTFFILIQPSPSI